VARTRRSRRPRLTIGLLVLASITIITLDYRGDAHGEISSLKRGASDAFAPVQRAVDDVTHPIGSFLAGAFNGGELQEENDKLRQENGQMQRQLLAQQAMANELKSLQALEHLPWIGSITPVTGGAGLVGQVIAAASSTCTVQLITDASPDAQVGVTFGSSSGNEGIVQGEGIGKPLTVNLVLPATSVHQGEVLTTSGLPDLVYPPAIPVARITRFSSTPSASQQSVSAQPVADLARLAYVDVLLWQPLH
jgi:rod shape-determining protein MreC